MTSLCNFKLIASVFSLLEQVLLHWVERSWKIDADGFVPSDQRRFLSEEALRPARIFKYLKRQFLLFVLGQRLRELDLIPASASRILWINLSASSIGDSLMDLSGAALLAGRQLHLLTSSKNCMLHAAGQSFESVFQDASSARRENRRLAYDLVIIDSFSPRSLLPKAWISSAVPFVGMYGFLNGYEVHRTIFSYRRIQRLLRYSPSGSTRVKPHYRLNRKVSTPKITSPYICIAVGAEWEFRRYPRWAQVIDGIPKSLAIVLIGSTNGRLDASEILREHPNVHDFVGKCSLVETVGIIEGSSYVLAADGGLWHIGAALSKPSVSLFADCKLFDESGNAVSRSTKDIPSVVLITKSQVSEISPSEVLSAFNLLVKRYDTRAHHRNIQDQ